MGRREAYTGFWWGYLMERDNLEVLDVDGRILLKYLLTYLLHGAESFLRS